MLLFIALFRNEQVVWCLLVPRKMFLQEEAFRPVMAQWPLDSISELHGILSNKNPPSTSGGNNHRLHVLGVSWTALDFLCLVFIRWPLVFKESIV